MSEERRRLHVFGCCCSETGYWDVPGSRSVRSVTEEDEGRNYKEQKDRYEAEDSCPYDTPCPVTLLPLRLPSVPAVAQPDELFVVHAAVILQKGVSSPSLKLNERKRLNQ